ncbi:HYR domain-containing protein [Oryzobacter terrae]|uniref:HYR domain-containing protein n=1 Tax=Oryzobacter terrae TaxID=1620385 RepID=UPI003670A122
MSTVRLLATAAAATLVIALGGSGALADVPVIDSDDQAAIITPTGPISFGNVCLGTSISTTRLIAAKRMQENPGNVRWANGTILTATASATGGAAAAVSDPLITLQGNWNAASDGTLSGGTNATATTTLSVVAASTPTAMSGTLTVTLIGAQAGAGGTSTLTKTASVGWTLNAVSCNTAPSITVNDITLEGDTLGGRTLTFADIGTAGDAEDAATPSVSCLPDIGSVLPLGANTVTCTAKDSANLSSSDSGVVTVVDTTDPVITGTPASVTLEATSSSGVAHTYVSPTASDVVSGTLPVTCSPASATFALGSTTVTCSAVDSSGNGTSTSFQVNVTDTTGPQFPQQPADVTAEASSFAGALVTFPAPSATDAVSGSLESTCSPASGSEFALGNTPVECIATDGAGNTAETSFVVRVVDTTAPELDVPGDITTEATSAAGAVVAFTATATDTVDDSPTVVCAPPSGGLFPVGGSTVSCTATDAAGNSSDAETFTVTVRDTRPPVLQGVPEDMTVEGNTTGGALVAYLAPTATDVVDPNPIVECEPGVSAFFELGETTVTCTATDDAGNVAEDTFTVTVVDTTAPALSNVPDDMTVEGNTAGGAMVSYAAPTANDIVDASPTVTCTPTSGAKFLLGTTTVTCSATDGSDNTSAEADFDVTVVDTTDPTITHESTLPAPNDDGWNSSDVTVTWSCSDVVGVEDATVTKVLADEGADQSAIGTCTDTSGNTASDTQSGIDIDETGPSAFLSVTAGTIGDDGWYRSNVTVGTSGSDDLSGAPLCTADQVLEVDSTGTVFSGSCTNLAGLTTAAAPITVKRDTVAPTISADSPLGSLGNNDWYTSAVTIPFSADDATSGVSVEARSFSVSSGSVEGAAVTVSSGPVKDNAGNEAASITTGPFKIDLSNPTGVAFVGGPAAGSSHSFGSVPAAPTCTASDAVSGISSCVVSGYSTAVGTHTLSATATDNAGRTATTTREYTVLAWTLKGFYAPVDMGGVYNVVKNGSTVPLKFEVFAGSSELTNVSAIASFGTTKITCSGTALQDELEIVSTGGTSLRYDTSGGQFIQNWQTPKTVGACYKVTMTTQDASTITAYFRLK